MILTHTNKHCPRHCLVMGQVTGQAIRKRILSGGWEREEPYREELQNFLWHTLKPLLPAMKVVNLASINLYSLHSGVLKELTQSSLGHYNYFTITFETVIQMLGTNPVMCEYFRKDKWADPGNYRSVNPALIFSKIMENLLWGLIHKELMQGNTTNTNKDGKQMQSNSITFSDQTGSVVCRGKKGW